MIGRIFSFLNSLSDGEISSVPHGCRSKGQKGHRSSENAMTGISWAKQDREKPNEAEWREIGASTEKFAALTLGSG